MSDYTFHLPDLGEGLTEAKVVQWHAQPGDTLRADDLMVSMETAKAIVDVPSPYHATISSHCAQAGQSVQTGAPLVHLTLKEKVETGTVAGELPTQMTAAGDETGQMPIMPWTHQPANVIGTGKISPYLRQQAQARALDLSDITPTGAQGTFTQQDLDNAARAQKQQAGFEPLDSLREAMAISMSQAHQQVVNTTIFDSVRLQWHTKQDMTVRCFKAWAYALQQVPALNAWYDHDTRSRRLIPTIDMAVAMDTPAGLLAPVIEDVANQSPSTLRQNLQIMKQQALDRTLRPEQLTGGSVLLSNFGSIAGQWATPQVVPPMVAILGIGRQMDQQLPVSLSFDHRVVTGGEAARALKAFMSHIQAPTWVDEALVEAVRS